MGDVMFSRKCILLFAAAYSMSDNGKTNEGVSVWYQDGDSLNPYENIDTGVKGYKPVKGNLPYEERHNIKTVPAVYEVGFTTKVNKENKIEILPCAVKYVSELSGEVLSTPVAVDVKAASTTVINNNETDTKKPKAS